MADPTVTDSSSTNSNKERVGKVFVVDPNPPGMEVIPPEDLFIYVKFSAYPRSSVTYGGTLEGDAEFFDSGVSDEVDFISTKISYKDGKLDPNPQQTYATTDWTEIGGFKRSDTRSSGILEGFGIKSIDIKYNASLVPVVDITFTDVRGSALFDVVEADDRKTPYSIFFKMPYPVFKLSIKGYFGQKVDYCLHMVNWTSNFDGSTGNFDISANFLGFQQAFLNDMVIGNIIGTVNTPLGRKNLDEIYNRRNSDIVSEDGRDLRQLDDFLTKIAKIQVDSEIIKSDSSNFEFLKNLNGKLSLLKSIRTFIGPAIPKESVSNGKEDKKQIEYLKRENKKDFYNTSSITDDELKINENYLSIRDFIVFKTLNTNSFKSYINTLSGIITKYNEYINVVKDSKYAPNDSVGKLKDESQSLTKSVKQNYDESVISAFESRTDPDNDWKTYTITDPQKEPKRFKLFEVIDEFINGNNTENVKLSSNYKEGDDSVNTNIDLETFKTNALVNGDKGGIYYKNPYKFKEDTNVYLVDFRKQRAVVENAIQKVESEIKEIRELVETELNEEILKNFQSQFGFRPTIDKCIEILSNNTQAMVETIYDISQEAEKKGDSRKQALRGLETDYIDGADRIAWPSIYQPNTDGSFTEIYIGETNVSENDFPELSFIEEVYKIIVAKRKNLAQITRDSVLKNGLDTDNWFPINPIDYDINPWVRLNSETTVDGIGNELLKNIFLRIAVLQNYSLFDTNTGLKNISDYARLDAIAMNKTIVTDFKRSIVSQVLDDIKNQLNSNIFVSEENFNVKKSPFWEDFVQDNNGSYKIKEENQPKIGNIRISGLYSDDVDYVFFDNSDIINNSKKLYKEISEDQGYREKIIDQYKKDGSVETSKFGESRSGDYFYKNFYRNNNLTTFNSYNVWDKSVGLQIVKSKNNTILDNLDGVALNIFNPTGSTVDSKYLNVSYMSLNNTNTNVYGDTIIETNLYQQQSDRYARALLLLSTFPFRKFEESFLKSVFTPNKVFNGARIINLPKLYVYYLGGLLMRYENQLSINFNVPVLTGNTTYSEFSTSNDKYLNLGYQRLIAGGDSSKIPNIEENLLKLPKKVKEQLITLFKIWVEGDRFNSSKNGFFELNMGYVVPSLSSTTTTLQKEQGRNYILREIKETTNMIVFDPKIFDPNRVEDLLVIPTQINQYIDEIKKQFDNITVESQKIPPPKDEKERLEQVKEKLQIYNYFKNINTKWVGGDKKSFNICGGGKKDLIDYFRFVDRGWRNIGSEATFNLNSFLTLGSNLNTSVYFFTSKLLRDSNFLFQILPTYINYKDVTEVAKMFQPQTQLETNSNTGPIFCCIYVGGNSEVLDISERSNYYFKNDGYRFPNPNDSTDKGDLPPDMTGPDDSSLVAFRVAFGAQNQTVFKNVSLSQQEHRETGEYFRALSDLVDKRGGTQKTYVGTDLLRLFKTRSYTCKVDALGCMNIQPLMYFDLQNVPFFNGAYLITSVNHNISPNHMTTNFQGVRQSKFITPPTDKITAELNLDLNETSEIPKIEYTNLDNKNPLYSIGVLNPTEKFDFVRNFDGADGLTNFKNLGVTQFSDERLREIIDEFKIQLENNGIETNSQVTTFMASVLSNSNNLSNKELPWNDVELEKNQVFENGDSGPTLYYGNVVGTSLVSSEPIIDQYKDSYLASVPLFTAGTTNDVAYLPKGNDDLKEYRENIRIESEKQIVKNKISNLVSTDPNYQKLKEKYEKDLDKLKKEEENLIKILTYYNIFKGDAYRFRPRGYLYMIGRKQYYDYDSVAAIKNPFILSKFEEDAILTSIKVWKKHKKDGKVAYDFSNIGNATSFSECVRISQQYKSPVIEVAFNTFENVLTVFTDSSGTPLIDYNNP